MLEKDTIIKVVNRDNGSVGYKIPDLNNLTRSFRPGEMKELTMEELRKLEAVPGGDYIIRNCLLIENVEAVEELLGQVEPEYFYNKEQIKELLLHGSLDAFLDCLDFAPKGVIDMVKDMAVTLKLNDIAKRKAILEKTGFNVTSAITINEACEEDGDEPQTETKRRVAVPTINATATERRAEAPKYKVTARN